MIGQRFAKLTVIATAPSILQTNGKRKGAVIARCDCGVEKLFVSSNLKSGNSKSCGCEKNRALEAFNKDRATPQEWQINGAIAFIEIKGVTVLVDASDVALVGQYRWGLRNGYAVARGGRIALHRLILGLGKGDPREGDHIHHNTTDNRRSELRIANSRQNKMNRRGNVGATSPYKGVSFDKSRGKYKAQIKAPGKQRVIGRFQTEREAAAAYNVEAAKYFGPFAYLNSI